MSRIHNNKQTTHMQTHKIKPTSHIDDPIKNQTKQQTKHTHTNIQTIPKHNNTNNNNNNLKYTTHNKQKHINNKHQQYVFINILLMKSNTKQTRTQHLQNTSLSHKHKT